jgi:hypothetical protein
MTIVKKEVYYTHISPEKSDIAHHASQYLGLSQNNPIKSWGWNHLKVYSLTTLVVNATGD